MNSVEKRFCWRLTFGLHVKSKWRITCTSIAVRRSIHRSCRGKFCSSGRLPAGVDACPRCPASLLFTGVKTPPVQTWLGQELEKCGIDAMIYTRYVLSLLLHDSYDYDLQEQENDIFLGWEKGAYKKWGKSKRKCSDLTLEEMKKQAAVQCLRSASDESSGIETLVEELCSRLKDLQSEQEEKIHKKLEGSPSPEAELSPTAKDQVEMYYEAFPPLSEKPVCLREIMTVWNNSKACASSSPSSSAAPPASTDTSSPKACNSEGEATEERDAEASSAVPGKTQSQGKNEKENKLSNGTAEEKPASYKKQIRHKPEGKMRPRSWSSGSSEAGSSSSGHQGRSKASATGVKARPKAREVRSRRGRSGPGRGAHAGGRGPARPPCRRGRGPPRAPGRGAPAGAEGPGAAGGSDAEFKEQPLWYTEPIAEYFGPRGRRSKLETTYRARQGAGGPAAEPAEEAAGPARGLCVGGGPARRTYLAAGTFVDGRFVEMPAVINEGIGLSGTAFRPPPEDTTYWDDIHLSGLTHFYEVDIDQSMLDPGASETVRGESRILNMIRQKSEERTDFEAECCIVLDGMELQGERAIWTDSTSPGGAEGFFLQDLGHLAQFWERCSSSSGDADGESAGGDSPARLSPVSGSTGLDPHLLAGDQELFSDINEGSGINSCFSVFEVQCSNSVLPFSFETLNLGNENTDSSANMLGKTQSRLLIWTKNSAFEENEHCSNLSTRTCSPWSHSEETRSDNETLNIQFEESAQFSPEEISYVVPPVSSNYVDEELLDFLQDETCQQDSRTLEEIPSLVFKKKSKLESVCGIQLEQKTENKTFETTQMRSESSPRGDGYSSGVIKDIWTKMADRHSVATVEIERTDGELFSTDVSSCCCCLDAEAEVEGLREPRKAVQRSEYHLWEGQKGGLEKRAFAADELAQADGGDYTTPSKPWDAAQDKENAFILGGVYGELKTFSSDGEWAAVPPGRTKAGLSQRAASDVVAVAGADVFMTPGTSFAPGHRQLRKPFVSFEQNDQLKSGENGLNKGFSFIFHEDLLGACGNFQVEDPGLEYSFSSFDLSNPFSQVLHVECSLEPEGIASLSPGFKPKSILCSDPDSEVFRPRTCGADRTQYRAIRVSPRTHFRPISASELSPGGGSESEFESEKDEANIPIPSQVDAFEDPQADLKPLEEDAEKEGHYYGKSELESGKFLPRLKKSGMEKSAQTSLDSQEESAGILPGGKQNRCLECSLNESLEIDSESSEANCKIMAQCEEEINNFCSCKAGCQFPAYEDNPVSSGQLEEFPVLNTDVHVQGVNRSQEKQTWWEKALYSPLFPTSECEVFPWTKMTDGNLSTSTNGIALMGILDCRPGSHIQNLQRLNLKAPRPLLSPEDGPKLKLGALEDRRSLQSVDSGIPTLEIGNPEPVPCSVVHVKRKQSESEIVPERACQSVCPLPSYAPPAPTSTEREQSVRKSSTFPRTGYDSVRLYSPTSKALNRSDDVSICSVSSLSTELSTALSISNEDILDLVVTSSSSAIVTLENDDDPQFTDVTLSSVKETRDLCQQGLVDGTEEGSKLKILGPFSNFFTRNLLARKQSARLDKQNDLGWKLFGKVPLRENAQKESKKMQKEYEDKTGRPSKPPSPKQNVRKNLDFEPLSTTALILEDRPANLPAKPAEEAQKHRQQYEEMVVQAKKRELKEAQRRKKQLEERCRLEESIGNAVLTWNNEILPNWETMWCSRKVRDLWWQGIPPSVRGKVWSLAIGNELNITHELFDICLARAKERWRSFSTGGSEVENEDAGFSAADREASLELIKLDISRTFPNLCIFQQVQGMSFIAAVLILNLDTADAFIAFSNLLNKPCQMAFFRVDHGLMLTYFAAFEVFFEENLPKLFAHFKKNNLTPDIYLIDWIFTLYSKSLPLDLACRIWDVFCRDGEEFLFRTALGVLKLFEDILTKMDFIHIAQFLTRLPEDLPAEEFFASIATIQMQSRNKKWAQVLTALQKDIREMEKGSPSLRH
ncbi:uncharacterized protein KIAA0232 isoform X3 [Manis javanica]|uniref:uncharacterized protein KIAA0232 isoform X3 n=1 Tax=Manis javanica TaxID=9974 RepID=UPI003C6D3349